MHDRDRIRRATGRLASLLAGFFLEHARREPIPQAPHVRQLQLDQGIAALRWACHELEIEAPPERPA